MQEELFEPTEEERKALREIAADQELSEAAVMRQALRLYQLVHVRGKAGETFHFSGDAQRAEEFAALASRLSLSGEMVERDRVLEEAARAAYPDPLYMGGNERDENGNLPPGSPYDRGRYDAAKAIRALTSPEPA